MNVTEQSMLSSYASGEILSARQKGRRWSPEGRCYWKAKLSEMRHEVPRRKKRQGKKPKPRDSFDVDRNILVTETEEDFCMLRGSEINSNSKQQLISTDQPVVRTTIGETFFGKTLFTAR